MAITLEYHEMLPGAQATRVAAREASLIGQVTETRIDLSAGATSKDSPLGLPPVLRDDNDPGGHPLTLFGGTGIATYLDQLAGLQNGPIFIPRGPCNIPLTYEWTELATSVIFPLVETLTRHGRWNQEPQRRQGPFGQAAQALKDLLTTLENKVFTQANPQFLVQHDGKVQFSLADIAVASGVTYVRIIPQGRNVRIDQFPRTQAYLEMIEARPAFKEVFAGVTLPKVPGEMPPPLTEPPNP
jgi:glutathione S-transferase